MDVPQPLHSGVVHASTIRPADIALPRTQQIDITPLPARVWRTPSRADPKPAATS